MALKTKILVGYGVAFALMGLVVAWAIANGEARSEPNKPNARRLCKIALQARSRCGA